MGQGPGAAALFILLLSLHLATVSSLSSFSLFTLASHLILPHLALCSVLQSFTVNVPVLDIKYVPHGLI